MATVYECLAILETSASDLSSCSNLQEEFSKIKKTYYKKALLCHPDKGGDANVFKKLNAAFEVLRDMCEKHKILSFLSTLDQSTTAVYMNAAQSAKGFQSWDYFQSAAEEPVPIYRVEKTKSGRGYCSAKGGARKCSDGDKVKIDLGEIRVGWMNLQSGTYSTWVHLKCWRVPSKVWLGLPNSENDVKPEDYETALKGMNEILFCGLSELSDEDRLQVVLHVMDKKHWAKLVKPKKKHISALVPGAMQSTSSSSAKSRKRTADELYAGASEALVRTAQGREKFMLPIPGKDGCVPGSLNGKTIVLSGIFPEVGGGAGLSLGKDKVVSMAQSFGGKVTGNVSSRTDILIVGKDPGFSKVSKAQSQPKCHVINLYDICQVVRGKTTIKDATAQPLQIDNFSAGYGYNDGRYNGLASGATAAQLANSSGAAIRPHSICNVHGYDQGIGGDYGLEAAGGCGSMSSSVSVKQNQNKKKSKKNDCSG